MTALEFCYWLQGYMEVENPKRLTAAQTRMVKAHLQLVFHKVTDPDMQRQTSAEEPGPFTEEDLERIARKLTEKTPRLAPEPSINPFGQTFC